MPTQRLGIWADRKDSGKNSHLTDPSPRGTEPSPGWSAWFPVQAFSWGTQPEAGRSLGFRKPPGLAFQTSVALFTRPPEGSLFPSEVPTHLALLY